MTFLPECSYADSFLTLDKKRLNKQLVEAYQIHKALSGKTKGWRNHPVTKMWSIPEIKFYMKIGRKIGKFVGLNVQWMDDIGIDFKSTSWKYPSWFHVFKVPGRFYPQDGRKPYDGEGNFILSCRCNLYRKDPTYYARYSQTWLDHPEYHNVNFYPKRDETNISTKGDR